MSEDAELQAKIAAITGQINQHKQQQQPFTPTPPYHRHTQYHPSFHALRGRWSPYGRGGRAGYAQQHPNRTLVLSGAQGSPSSAVPAAGASSASVASPHAVNESFVSTRAPGKAQLISKDTYEREQKHMLEQKKHARAVKRQRINDVERIALMQHVKASPASDGREVVVNGLRYQLREDGSKLMRIHGALIPCDAMQALLNSTDPVTGTKETPKRVTIADVTFYRTKTGNMVRATAVRNLTRYPAAIYHPANGCMSSSNVHRSRARRPLKQCDNFTKNGTELPILTCIRTRNDDHLHSNRHASNTNIWTGNCPFGPACKFSHDPEKVAICKTFLKTGSCAAGNSCDLSHSPTYHRVPACTHFLRGNCTKEACLYPHVHVSPSAPVCRPFATLGYCDNGEDCPKRHVFECPDYSNRGFCANRENGKCQLAHPDHASVLRKAAARQARTASENESDVSSDEEMQIDDHGVDDIDSDEAEEVMMADGDDDHALTQQRDFIAFS